MINTVKMICPNVERCMNRSVVYRKLDGIRQNNCKACGSELVKLKVQNQLTLKQNEKAKRELRELGL